MPISDRLLKQLVTTFAPDFAAWLLNAEVDETEVLPGGLPVETIIVDALFRVRLKDGRTTLLHFEFQGRRSHRPMPLRMLDYLARVVPQYELPILSVVLYLDRGAGSNDTGSHQRVGPDGTPVLTWKYRVIHLWRIPAEDLLALERPSLLPLVGLTEIVRPTEVLPKVVERIRNEADAAQQKELLQQLIGLMKDEEIIAMTKQLLSDLELEDLKEHPFLWEQYQRYQERIKTEGRAEGERQKARDNILEVIAVRFNPTAMDYRRVEQMLAMLSDLERLNTLFSLALRSNTFAEYEQALHASSPAEKPEPE
ncbi:MAG: Rpn family recombination-promoting nuclease/putative transposase [Chloroflexaceae bacterium]